MPLRRTKKETAEELIGTGVSYARTSITQAFSSGENITDKKFRQRDDGLSPGSDVDDRSLKGNPWEGGRGRLYS